MKRTFLVIGLWLMSSAIMPGAIMPGAITPVSAQTGEDTLIPDSAQTGEKPLYERLGGEAAIEAVVDQFVANNDADEMIAPRWKAADVAALKEDLAELICQATGGPCVYTGVSMEVAHSGLNVTEEEFNRVAVNLSSALDKFSVPQKEKGELLAIIGSLKGQVVGQ